MFGIPSYLLGRRPREHSASQDSRNKVFLPRYLDMQEYVDPPRFCINLDTPPGERWKAVAKHFADEKLLSEFRQLLNVELEAELGYFWRYWVAITRQTLAWSEQFSASSRLGVYHFALAELEGLARAMTNFSGILFDAAELYVFSTLRSLNSDITTVVMRRWQEGPVHNPEDANLVQMRSVAWRNLTLRKFAIDACFFRDDVLIFRAATFLGSVGCDNGMRLGHVQVTRHRMQGSPIRYSPELIREVKKSNVEFVLSMAFCKNTPQNDRVVASSFFQKIAGLATSRAVPPSLLIRRTLETAKTFEAARFSITVDSNGVDDDVYFTLVTNSIANIFFRSSDESKNAHLHRKNSVKELTIADIEKRDLELGRCLVTSYHEFLEQSRRDSEHHGFLAFTDVFSYARCHQLVLYRPMPFLFFSSPFPVVDTRFYPDSDAEKRIQAIVAELPSVAKHSVKMLLQKFLLVQPFQRDHEICSTFSTTFNEAVFSFRLSTE